MCGIVGIVKLNRRDTVEEARLKRMRDVLRHRGPDGEGLWIEGPVGLGMRLQGMFAFALWDRKQRRLLLARDRLGIKPLYFAWTDHERVFASEIKAIVAGGSLRPALNQSIVPEFLALAYVAGEETFFRGVQKLLPGRTLSWSCAGGPRQRRYWRLPVGDQQRRATNRLTMIHRSLRAAIETDRTIPILTHWFESSVPGLYFVGLTSLRAFGPLYRFVAGCGAAAQRVASAIARGWRGRSRAVSSGMPMAAGS